MQVELKENSRAIFKYRYSRYIFFWLFTLSKRWCC